MIFDVDNLSHILDPVTNSLPLASSDCDLSESWGQVLILWCLALNRIEVELILIAGPADASLISVTASFLEPVH